MEAEFERVLRRVITRERELLAALETIKELEMEAEALGVVLEPEQEFHVSIRLATAASAHKPDVAIDRGKQYDANLENTNPNLPKQFKRKSTNALIPYLPPPAPAPQPPVSKPRSAPYKPSAITRQNFAGKFRTPSLRPNVPFVPCRAGSATFNSYSRIQAEHREQVLLLGHTANPSTTTRPRQQHRISNNEQLIQLM